MRLGVVPCATDPRAARRAEPLSITHQYSCEVIVIKGSIIANRRGSSLR